MPTKLLDKLPDGATPYQALYTDLETLPIGKVLAIPKTKNQKGIPLATARRIALKRQLQYRIYQDDDNYYIQYRTTDTNPNKLHPK